MSHKTDEGASNLTTLIIHCFTRISDTRYARIKSALLKGLQLSRNFIARG